jgi:transposase
VDSARLAVNRRHRRAKADRLEVPKRLTMLLREVAGDTRGWSSVRVPRLAEDDRRQRHRAVATTQRDRPRVINRLKGLLASPGLVRPPRGAFPQQLASLRLGDGSPLPAGLRQRLGQAWAHVQVLAQRMAPWAAERRALLQRAAAAALNNVRQLLPRKGRGTTSAGGVVMAGFGWRAFRSGTAVGALSGLPPTPEARGLANAGNDHRRAMALELAWGGRRLQPTRALTPWSQPRFGHGGRRFRRIGLVALARKLRMALGRWVETGVLPDGAALKAAVRLYQQRWSTGCETGLGWAAREATGVALRTEREKGRPTTALSRRHERMPEQVFGGQRPTRIEGGLRPMSLTHARALGTVAARRDRLGGARGEIASARRDERKRLTSAPT